MLGSAESPNLCFQTPNNFTPVTVDKIALDQLRSAFEIADTDGDGILVTVEIQEAIHAVADNVPVIDFVSVPSFTFLEFSLFCVRLLDHAQPVLWLCACLDRLVAFTHETWVEHTMPSAIGNLTNSLHQSLFIPTEDGEEGGIVSRDHIEMWQQVAVTVEGEAGSESEELEFMPTKPSSALSVCLAKLETDRKSVV